MKNYTFWIPISGIGDDPKEGWNDALNRLQESLMQDDGWEDNPPADIFGKDEPVPAAEILGGSLSNGFGVDQGEEEIEEINPHSMPED